MPFKYFIVPFSDFLVTTKTYYYPTYCLPYIQKPISKWMKIQPEMKAWNENSHGKVVSSWDAVSSADVSIAYFISIYLHKWNGTIENRDLGRSKDTQSFWKFPTYFPELSHLSVTVLQCSQKGKSSLINIWELAAAVWVPRHWLTRGFRPLAWTIQSALQHLSSREDNNATKAYVLIMLLKLSRGVIGLDSWTKTRRKRRYKSWKVNAKEKWFMRIKSFFCRFACAAHRQIISI